MISPGRLSNFEKAYMTARAHRITFFTMRLSILLVTTLTVKVINGMSPVPACEDETVCCPELLLGGAAVDCEQCTFLVKALNYE